MINGFKIYQKIKYVGRFRLANSFLPKYKIPRSANMIRIRIVITDPRILLLPNNEAKKKQN